jgi:hypothetical protein
MGYTRLMMAEIKRMNSDHIPLVPLQRDGAETI